MGVYAGPEITSDGLVLALDAGNTKGFDDDENLLTYSEQFNDASWVKFNVGVTTNTSSTTAPDGNANSELMTRTTTSPAYFLKGYTKAASSITYTASAFAKKSVGNFCALTTQGTYPSRAAVVFDINSGTISTAAIAYGSFTNASASITSYPNGWYRISLTATSDTATVYDTYFSFNSNGGEIDYTDSVSNSAGFIWGAQLETGSSASPYYPTTGTAKTRGSTLIDMTGRGNTGTLTNGPTYSSANGGSLMFDGVDDYVLGTINGSIFTGSFTQSAWIYKLNNNQIWQGVFTNSSPATNNTYLMTFGNGSVAAPFNSVGANQVGISESGVFLDIGTHTNRWLYIVMTKTGSTLNIYCYKDGTLLQTSGTINWNGGNFATTNNYEIGRHWAGGSIVPLQGNISQVSVYNRALTAAEVSQNFNAIRSRYGI